MMSEENFKNREDLEVTFLACFLSFQICISETFSTCKNYLTFCIYYSIYILCLVAIGYSTIKIIVRFSF